MSTLNYERLSKKPRIFIRMTGLSLEEFEQVHRQVQPEWEAKVGSLKKAEGRPSPLKDLKDKLLVLFIYYRSYVTHEFLGYLFGLHNANICRLFKKLEPIVARKVSIKKDRSLTEEEVLKILADVTEQPIQRPQKSSKRKKTYSGKKKQNTQKIEIVMGNTGRILSVSHTYPGRVHDFRVRKQEKPLPRDAQKYVDSGYQGLQKLTRNVHLPFKRKKGKLLSPDEKQYNRQQSSLRIRVEHKIRELKVFKILSEKYRNFGKKHHLRFNIIAGIMNMRYGF